LKISYFRREEVELKRTSPREGYTKIGQWNVRSANTYSKREDLMNYLKREEIDICSIQETKIKSNELNGMILEDYVLINFAADKGNKNGSGVTHNWSGRK
jgi:exonuclease III